MREHEIHVCDVACVKAAQVEGRQFLTACEHVIHVCDVACVKAAQVEGRQFIAIIEHEEVVEESNNE